MRRSCNEFNSINFVLQEHAGQRRKKESIYASQGVSCSLEEGIGAILKRHYFQKLSIKSNYQALRTFPHFCKMPVLLQPSEALATGRSLLKKSCVKTKHLLLSPAEPTDDGI